MVPREYERTHNHSDLVDGHASSGPGNDQHSRARLIQHRDETKLMNTDALSMSSFDTLPHAASDIARQATDEVKNDAVAAQDIYGSMSSSIEDGMFLTEEVDRHSIDWDASHRAADAECERPSDVPGRGFSSQAGSSLHPCALLCVE